MVGVVDALDDPAQRARIDSLIAQAVSAAATAAVEKATRQLVAELGSNGEGPLAVSLAKTGERAAAAAVGGVGSELQRARARVRRPRSARLPREAVATDRAFDRGVILGGRARDPRLAAAAGRLRAGRRGRRCSGPGSGRCCTSVRNVGALPFARPDRGSHHLAAS